MKFIDYYNYNCNINLIELQKKINEQNELINKYTKIIKEMEEERYSNLLL